MRTTNVFSAFWVITLPPTVLPSKNIPDQILAGPEPSDKRANAYLRRACLIFIALPQGQRDNESAPFSRHTPGGNCPVVAINYLPAYSQPYSRAFIGAALAVQALKGLENPVKI